MTKTKVRWHSVLSGHWVPGVNGQFSFIHGPKLKTSTELTSSIQFFYCFTGPSSVAVALLLNKRMTVININVNRNNCTFILVSGNKKPSTSIILVSLQFTVLQPQFLKTEPVLQGIPQNSIYPQEPVQVHHLDSSLDFGLPTLNCLPLQFLGLLLYVLRFNDILGLTPSSGSLTLAPHSTLLCNHSSFDRNATFRLPSPPVTGPENSSPAKTLFLSTREGSLRFA